MIYTVTLNPSLDYIVEMNNITLGALNRTKNEAILLIVQSLAIQVSAPCLISHRWIFGWESDDDIDCESRF